jgi:tripeptide aminopeptidase
MEPVRHAGSGFLNSSIKGLMLYKIPSFIFVYVFIVSGTNAGQPEHQNNTDDPVALQEQFQQEIDNLVEQQIILDAFRFIEDYDDQTVQNQIHLSEIPAPPFMEDRRAERYAEMMQEFGLDEVTIDKEGNAIGRRPGTSGERTIAISAHLDTVFPEETDVTVEVRNDTLFGPGISDDARGLTSVLTILKTFQELDIQTQDDILFVGTVGEEGLGDLRGVKYLFRENGPQIDAFISIDGSNDTRIVNQALGSHRYRITFKGPGGHSWGAFGIANPAHALGRTIHHFDENASQYVAEGARTSYNIGRIGGGTSVNSVPFENWMEIDMRSVDQDRLFQIDDILQEAIQQGLDEANEIRNSGPALTVDVDMIGDRPSGEIDPNEPFIQRAMAATKYFGETADLRRSSTDSNVPISMGIPSMTLGGGGSSGSTHSLDEWWYNDEGHRGIQRALLILVAEAGLANN